MLRDLGGELRQERCRVPRAALDAAGLAPHELRVRGAGRSEALRPLLTDLATAAHVNARPPAGPAGRWYALRRALLEELARGGFDVLDAKTSLTPLRKLWVAWRA
jgi:phytoene synthase